MNRSVLKAKRRHVGGLAATGFAVASVGVLIAGQSAATAATAAQPTPAFTVVADHLANPRGLSFAGHSDSTLFVAEAGLGAGTSATGVQIGTGQSGRVAAISEPDGHHPMLHTVRADLWSQTSSAEHGFETVGPAGIAVRYSGAMFVAMSESFSSGLGPQPQEGRLLRLAGSGAVSSVADVATADLGWEAIPANAALNVGQFPDVNPYGVTMLRNHKLFVVDAAANTVDEIGLDGSVRVIAYIPNIVHSDAVPTCITQGPDGALYVGTLAIADGPGAAKVYRIDPETTASVTTAATVWASGLSAINGCAFSPDGKYFYASEFLALETMTGPPAPGALPPSAVVKIPFAAPSNHTYLALGSLHFPGGVAVDTEGNVYVSNWSNQGPGTPIGQVVRLTNDHN